MSIDLIKVAKYFNDEPHQREALDYLEDNTSPDILKKFASIWRNEHATSANKLSKNFTLDELIKSQTAQRYGINNKPTSQTHLNSLRRTATKILQPVRDHFDRPVIVSSGYRSPELNKRIGGSRTSQHCVGEAADFEIPGLSNLVVAKWICYNLTYDQLILEFYDGRDPNSGWIHCSVRASGNRKQSMVYNGGKYQLWNP